MFQPNDEVMIYAKVKEVVNRASGVYYRVQPLSDEFESMMVSDKDVRQSDDVILKQMEEEMKEEYIKESK